MIISNDNILNSPVRSIKAKVELYNGATLAATYSYLDAVKSITIETLGEENKFFGFGVTRKINIKLRDIDRSIKTSTNNRFKVYFSSGGEYVNAFPTFYETEANRDENTNELSITAYDDFQSKKFALYTVGELNLVAYTVRGFVEAVVTKLGLSGFEFVGGVNVDRVYEKGANFEGTETLREALNAVAELTGTVYYLNGEDKLIFKGINVDINPAALTIDRASYIELDSKTNRRLSTIEHITELGDNVKQSTYSVGSTQFIRNNPFLEFDNAPEEALLNLLFNKGDLTINQFSCNWRGNFLLEIGDKIDLVTKDNKVVTSYFLNDTLEYDGSLSQKTQWSYTNDNETASSPSTLGESLKQTYAKVDRVNKQIDIVASEVGANAEAISALQINTESINASVEKLETQTNEALGLVSDNLTTLNSKVEAQITAEDIKIEISKELANGVETVSTGKGYTLNDEGLTIEDINPDSNNVIKTTVSNNGMVVKSNNTAVLTANDIGVNARNLHATTYLIIGNNSRFEDYGYNRTGCFWIGGSN